MLSDIESHYQRIIDDVIYGDQVKKTLISNIAKKLNIDSIKCDTCNSTVAVLHLMVNIRLHHTLKLANKSLSQDKTRKNRKVMKFAHL